MSGAALDLTDWPAKLREAAAWFDTVDRLIASIKVIPIEGDTYTYDLIEKIGRGREIQDDLNILANRMETLTSRTWGA